MTHLPYHRVDGPAAAPVLLLGPSLGTSLAVWDAQIPVLARHFRVVRWDLPGHGGSAAGLLPVGGTVGDLGRLALGVADAVGAGTFGYAGISLGGAVGAWVAAHHPERVSRLALVCSSARFGPPDGWRVRAAAARADGTGHLAYSAPARWFTPAYAEAAPPALHALLADQRRADPEAYARCCEALAEADLRADLALITAPTLVLAGREDVATPPADHARPLADGIRDAQLTEIPRAAHLANVERPDAVSTALLAHFAPPSASAATGTAVRRAVLGDEHVDRAIARTTPFTARFQDFITRYAWGEIWTGDTLDRRTRSSITLTALVAGGHQDELALHVRAALRNGLTPEEIAEVILQAAVYCGVPAANSAFAVADRVLTELGLGGPE
ncbi:4-carboxymuconolactone decarboxylase [Streptomyces sp. CBMA29]|uniref:bifunctional 3-oxoadipate enol-lactonase/4-carboxymuconolactone decarboxylase PcaDC n=1 Tax=Streptomyces sp. CBMA29 TaxID=1896314 RepID=UPI00166200A4|nr:4-carboxymuconolactone decarboxylase [Streptomyces sp. CBMA29]MBD0735615.1 4-carboxymuconolactone decarboxylase [Streptomyces sp. CBMA29]